jgi:hypothetical protein
MSAREVRLPRTRCSWLRHEAVDPVEDLGNVDPLRVHRDVAVPAPAGLAVAKAAAELEAGDVWHEEIVEIYRSFVLTDQPKGKQTSNCPPKNLPLKADFPGNKPFLGSEEGTEKVRKEQKGFMRPGPPLWHSNLPALCRKGRGLRRPFLHRVCIAVTPNPSNISGAAAEKRQQAETSWGTEYGCARAWRPANGAIRSRRGAPARRSPSC